MDALSAVVQVAVVVAFAALYFAPTYAAARRAHPNRVGIFLLNLLLGWTVIGWIAALLWAITVQPNLDTPQNKLGH
jgi:hypothetical protein